MTQSGSARSAQAKAAGQDGGSRRPEAGERPKRQETAPRAMALDLPEGELSEAMQAYFRKCEDKIGFVPNVLRAYAIDNAKLEAFAAFYNDLMLAPSGLSAENRCFYCLAAHGAAVRQLSGDPALGDLMAMNYRAAELSARHRAMLDFSVKLTRESYAIGEEDREALRRAGFGEKDIWDIAAVASFYNMSNRMASAVDMRPNPEYHAQAR